MIRISGVRIDCGVSAFTSGCRIVTSGLRETAPFKTIALSNFHIQDFIMSRLSSSLKALINAPTARPHTVPAPANIASVYSKIQQTAQAQQLSQPSWIALSVSNTLPAIKGATLQYTDLYRPLPL